MVAGVDEVGRGAWAGPLSVGVAVLGFVVPSGHRIPRGLRDSKLLTEEQRERIFLAVGAWCAAWSVGHASAAECDSIGMTAALRLASARAFAVLPAELLPDAVLLDGNFDFVSPPAAPDLFAPPHPVPGWFPTVRTVVGADRTCASVAAASVLAKVTRDRHMRGLSDSFPAFDFDRNKGYPSPAHKEAQRGYGPHRPAPAVVGVRGTPALGASPRRWRGCRGRAAGISRAWALWGGRGRARR